jgi:alkylhydroperoxidase/carboxymuconolactone decarboxylase family protein YurZ
MKDRHTKGTEIMNSMFGEMTGRSPALQDFGALTKDYLFGEVWSRPGLELRDRSLVTITVLVATGKEKQLHLHLKGAISNGLSIDELKESIMHAAHYCGWPSGINGLRVLQEVADEQGLKFPTEV